MSEYLLELEFVNETAQLIGLNMAVFDVFFFGCKMLLIVKLLWNECQFEFVWRLQVDSCLVTNMQLLFYSMIN